MTVIGIDLGGGTFDISILELFEGVMEVKSIAGDNFLGGEDFNKILVEYFIETNNLDLNELNKKQVSALFEQAELCKKSLSDNQKAVMSLRINEKTFETELDRNKFERLSQDLILRLRHPVERALRDADIQPDEAVALGASIQAALKEKNSDLKEIKIHPRDKTENRLILARGERLFEEALGEEREYISKILSEFERILETQDLRLIEKSAKLLSERLDELENNY